MASRSLMMLLLAAFLAVSRGDVYLHSPRGQNDRCDEKSNNRSNDKRCFNSQNNAAGGYATCDKEMVFYTDTVMNIEWYSQHNCGNGAQSKTDPSNPEGVHCQHILQLGCDFAFSQFADGVAYTLTDGKSLGRPGADAANKVTTPDDVFNTFGNTCTQTRPSTATCAEGTHNSATCATLDLSKDVTVFNSNACSCSPRKMQTYCYHEPEAYWLKCQARERNKGLFNADQAVRNNGGATATRQNPNTSRYGFECSEERDYWPYWHPTPYIDLAVFTSDTSKCTNYLANSQNTNNKCECVTSLTAPTANQKRAAMVFNQEAPCTKAGNTWKCWSQWNYTAPECLQAPFQPDNALGRVTAKGDNAENLDGSSLASYQWTIPESLIPTGQAQARCFIRLRYNISNANVPDDYDVADNTKLQNDPVYTFGSGNARDSVDKTMPLRLAIDTAQYGRTFQDRSYTFTIKRRSADLVGKTIHNLNVRGKRGNIAQVRNCFEYDFVPLVLTAKVGDLVHFQWCLSDYNDNGNAGEGRDGTDRVNAVPISSYDLNTFPSLNTTASIFSATDLAQLAWLGQQPQYCYSTQEMLTTQQNNGQGTKSCHFLNGVRDASGLPTAYFSYMATVTNTGTLKFMSSRNNNFSNRSQKAVINVGVGSGGLSTGAIAGIAVGASAGVAAVGGAGVFMIKKKGLLSFSSRV